jgi:uncharacterized Ntn-hydrolase superfamily protein
VGREGAPHRAGEEGEEGGEEGEEEVTFSIVARQRDAWGVAVASKFLAVGAIVPHARAGVGAVTTQANANASFGPRGLDLLGRGFSARETLDALLAEDGAPEQRQVGIVDARGRAATHTGAKCHAWAGGRVGRGYACQGNILSGERVVDAMADAWAASDGDLASRLLAALSAGDEAGGDRRGRQSAALLVAREGGGYGGTTDRMVDLRSDDHPRPLEELARMLSAWRLHFEKPRASVALEGRVKSEVARRLRALGHLGPGEPLTLERFDAFLDTENFEERRWSGWRIDTGVLAWLRSRRVG